MKYSYKYPDNVIILARILIAPVRKWQNKKYSGWGAAAPSDPSFVMLTTAGSSQAEVTSARLIALMGIAPFWHYG